MTLDVKIGKLIIDRLTIDRMDKKFVQACPIINHYLCNPKLTLWPRESYRSGGSGFWDFWYNCTNGLFLKFNSLNPKTEDRYIIHLKPYIDEINSLSDDCGNEIDNDRMKWFKFWSNRAVELYGDDACIQFS